MGAQQEQHDGHAQQEFLGGRVLIPVVDLLPHVEVIVGARVEVEGHAAHPVEHQVGPTGVADVCQEPRGFLRDARHDVEEDLEGCDEHDVDEPGTCCFCENAQREDQRGEGSGGSHVLEPMILKAHATPCSLLQEAHRWRNPPFALTHPAFKFGETA